MTLYRWTPTDGGTLWIGGKLLRPGFEIEIDGTTEKFGVKAAAGLVPVTAKADVVEVQADETPVAEKPRKRGRPRK